MSSTEGEEPPLKKTKKKKPLTEPNSISSLPDDLIVSCLARVSRLHYPILSLVSKSFQSYIASPEIYKTRSLLNRTESCLYVCLQFPYESNPRWFTLCKKTNQTLTKKRAKKERSSGYVLAPIRTLNSPILEGSKLVSAGSNLYAISGEFRVTAPCTDIPFLDCRTHTWIQAPSMRVAYTDEKVYLPGYNENQDSSSLNCMGVDRLLYLPGSNENEDSSALNCIEVFNAETQTWNRPMLPDKRLFRLRNMEGKIYLRSSKNRAMAYKPKESTWELVDIDKMPGRVVCFIENIIYSYKGGFVYIDNKSNVKGELKGLEGLPKFAGYSSVKLVDYGGNLVVLWDKYVPAKGGYKEKMIWCAEISLEKRNNGEDIWGKVEWVDAVLRVPKSYEFVYAIAATV